MALDPKRFTKAEKEELEDLAAQFEDAMFSKYPNKVTLEPGKVGRKKGFSPKPIKAGK